MGIFFVLQLVYNINERGVPKIKLNNLTLNTNIHTLEIETKWIDDISDKPFISNNARRKVTENEYGKRYYYIVNLNKYHTAKADSEITNIKDFKKVYAEMLDNLNVKYTDELKKTRIDFKVDDKKNSYNSLYKLNLFLVSLIAAKLNINENFWLSNNSITLDKLSICAKSSRRSGSNYYEIECYNKRKQNRKQNVETRLEFRLKNFERLAKTEEYKNFFVGMNEYNKEEYCIRFWVYLLKDVVTLKNIKTLTKQKNIYLYYQYKEQREKVVSINEFISKYEDHFFTEEQLIDFYFMDNLAKKGMEQLEKTTQLTNNEKSSLLRSAKRKKNQFLGSRSNIQLYTKADLQQYTKLIIESFKRFVVNDK